MVADPEDLSELRSAVLEGAALSREVVVAIHDNELLGASGNYGDPLAGDPLQYNELIIEHVGGTTRIVVYNRAIMLFTTDEEIYKQVHRVCCAIENGVDLAQPLSRLRSVSLRIPFRRSNAFNAASLLLVPNVTRDCEIQRRQQGT